MSGSLVVLLLPSSSGTSWASWGPTWRHHAPGACPANLPAYPSPLPHTPKAPTPHSSKRFKPTAAPAAAAAAELQPQPQGPTGETAPAGLLEHAPLAAASNYLVMCLNDLAVRPLALSRECAGLRACLERLVDSSSRWSKAWTGTSRTAPQRQRRCPRGGVSPPAHGPVPRRHLWDHGDAASSRSSPRSTPWLPPHLPFHVKPPLPPNPASAATHQDVPSSAGGPNAPPARTKPGPPP